MFFEATKETRKWSAMSRFLLFACGAALIFLEANVWFFLPIMIWMFVHFALFLKVDTTRDPNDIL